MTEGWYDDRHYADEDVCTRDGKWQINLGKSQKCLLLGDGWNGDILNVTSRSNTAGQAARTSWFGRQSTIPLWGRGY